MVRQETVDCLATVECCERGGRWSCVEFPEEIFGGGVDKRIYIDNSQTGIVKVNPRAVEARAEILLFDGVGRRTALEEIFSAVNETPRGRWSRSVGKCPPRLLARDAFC